MRRGMPLVCACLLSTGCGASDPEPEKSSDPGPTLGNGEYVGVHAVSAPYPLAPGDEELDLCATWTLGNEETLYVSKVDLAKSVAVHHSNWIVFDESRFPGEDAVWSQCDDRRFSLFEDAGYGNIVFTQSTQATSEVHSFGEGVAVPIPPRARLLVNAHMLNTGEKAVEAELDMKLVAIPEADVDVRLRDISGFINTLAIPPRTKSRFTTECEFPEGTDWSMHFVMPHYHYAGTGMFFEIYGGPDDGKVIFDSEGAVGEPLGETIDPPVSLAGGKGIRFGCNFENATDETLRFGSRGNQEMCFFVTQTSAESAWFAYVSSYIGSATLTDLGVDAAGIHQFSAGPCKIVKSGNVH